MKKRVVLCAAVLMAFSSVSVLPVFPQETEDRETLLSDDTKEALKEGGTKLLLDMQSALQKASETVDKKVKAVTSKACVGTWRFTNGKYSTTIKCSEDSSMEIIQTSALGATVSWRGNYVSSLSQIEFTVTSKITSTMFTKKTEALNAVWRINYSLPQEGCIRVVSEAIPDDANGYSFKNPTLFTSVK